MALQETDLDECHCDFIRQEAEKTGCYLCLAEPMYISQMGAKRFGRRAGPLIRSSVPPFELDDKGSSDYMRVLKESLRWMEGAVPSGTGSKYVIIVSLCGIAAASPDATKKQENARLIGAALVRQAHFNDIPYYICTDLNEAPDQCEITRAITVQDWVHDLTREWLADEDATVAPTYCKPQVYEHMSGTGITRIDTMMANEPGSNCVDNLGYG